MSIISFQHNDVISLTCFLHLLYSNLVNRGQHSENPRKQNGFSGCLRTLSQTAHQGTNRLLKALALMTISFTMSYLPVR
jgi:hypothetical protein